jgi:hypothetical protein
VTKTKDKADFTRRLYGDGLIVVGDVKKQLSECGGDIEVHVVENPHGDEKSPLVYGLFYRHPSGHAYDIIQAHDLNLKFYNSVDRLAAITTKFGLSSLNVSVGVKKAIEYGSLRKK